NRAVIRPQAMNAVMLGITMPARYPPNRWTDALRPFPWPAGGYGMLVMSSCSFGNAGAPRGDGGLMRVAGRAGHRGVTSGRRRSGPEWVTARSRWMSAGPGIRLPG